MIIYVFIYCYLLNCEVDIVSEWDYDTIIDNKHILLAS